MSLVDKSGGGVVEGGSFFGGDGGGSVGENIKKLIPKKEKGKSIF